MSNGWRSYHEVSRSASRSYPILNQRVEQRIPSHVYNLDGRTRYSTDSRGRVIEVDAVIDPNAIAGRPPRIPGNQTSTVQVDGYPGLDHGGHIVANQNGGASERINIVALDRLLNQGQRDDWREMEDLIREGAASGRTVRMETTIEYGDVGAPNRPVEIKVTVTGLGRYVDPFEFENGNL